MAAMGREARISIAATDDTGAAFRSVQAKFGALYGTLDTTVQRFTQLAGVAVAATAALGAARGFSRIVDDIDRFNDLADATGASVEKLSALDAVARQTGASFDTVSQALVKFNQVLNNAGSPEVAKVLQAIGLSAEELRRLDPADALVKTARALDQFASDGSRARAEQLLFGKSLREVAPLLRDLAEAGDENARITTEQALAAERFNRLLASVSANATDAGRSLALQLLPALNDVLVRVRAASELSLREFLGAKAFADAADGIRFYQEELRKLNQQRAQLPAFAQSQIPLFDQEEVRLNKLLQFYRRVGGETAAARAKILGDDFSDRSRDRRDAPSLQLPEGPGKSIKAQVSEFDKYLERLEQTLQLTKGLSTAEQVRADLAVGKLGQVSQAQRETLLLLAEAIDKAKQEQPVDLIGEELRKARQRELDELNALISSSSESQLDKLVALTQRLAQAQRDGDVTLEDYVRGIGELGKRFDALRPRVEEAARQVDEFSSQAARNIQDTLGETLERVLSGNFKSIGDLWQQTIQRMIAQAAAARLNEYLFGGAGGSGNAGVVGGFFASLFGGRRATGGRVSAGRLYEVNEMDGPGELLQAGGRQYLMPRQDGMVRPADTAAAGGAGASYTLNFYGNVGRGAAEEVREALREFERGRQRNVALGLGA